MLDFFVLLHTDLSVLSAPVLSMLSFLGLLSEEKLNLFRRVQSSALIPELQLQRSYKIKLCVL